VITCECHRVGKRYAAPGKPVTQGIKRRPSLGIMGQMMSEEADGPPALLARQGER